MSDTNTEAKSFNKVAIVFHGVMGLLMITAIGLALVMTEMDNAPEKYELYGIHKSIGIIVLVLFLPRLLWRFKSGHPGKMPTHKTWEKHASNAASWALYILMFAMPLSGWIMSSAGGHGVSVFGLIDIPAIVEKNKELGGLFHDAHELMGKILQILIVLHVLGALKHLVIDKDLTLYRMVPLPFLKPKDPK